MARRWDLAAASARLVAAAVACGSAQAGIYSCTDAKGRRITADRPIPECIDREQKEFSPKGMPLRVIGPTLTPLEQAARKEAERKAAEQALKMAEERRQNRVLLARYPNEEAHAAERAKVLAELEDQPAEKARAVKRFDDELARLRMLWAAARTVSAR